MRRRAPSPPGTIAAVLVAAVLVAVGVVAAGVTAVVRTIEASAYSDRLVAAGRADRRAARRAAARQRARCSLRKRIASG